jgi:glycosyltransferase involved in cell wall biosynthesis
LADQKRIVFLYSEMANYFLVCIKQLQIQTDHEIHVFHFPLNPEAPFKFDLNIKGITFYDRSKFDYDQLNNAIKALNPVLMYCSGWIDKDYVKICARYKSKIPVVGGFDTPWIGTLKQQLNAMLGGITIRKYFSHVWIAGQPQLKYAQKLGFKQDKILQGVYSADVNYFDAIYKDNLALKANDLPKRFIFVGRYLEFKGIFDLWKAFIKTFDHLQHDWELWCLGTGALWDKRVEHPKIKHRGFIQPNQMDEYMKQTSVFILPSHFEPWAVALHEFTAAGFPVICSDKVGAISAFLKEGQNGFVFPSGDVEALTNCIIRFIQMSSNEVLQFGKHSNRLAKTITPDSWAATLRSLI